mmetsp:Transcript_17455/g.37720  ORF Transcript_17455/g.37720 Transcript_17455/m.37720 type:complete len:202 (+) Transcript_17455:3-608(+)
MPVSWTRSSSTRTSVTTPRPRRRRRATATSPARSRPNSTRSMAKSRLTASTRNSRTTSRAATLMPRSKSKARSTSHQPPSSKWRSPGRSSPMYRPACCIDPTTTRRCRSGRHRSGKRRRLRAKWKTRSTFWARTASTLTSSSGTISWNSPTYDLLATSVLPRRISCSLLMRRFAAGSTISCWPWRLSTTRSSSAEEAISVV